MNLEGLVKHQIKLIENGKLLEAFMKFFSDKVIMRNNNTVFASNKKEGMEIQSKFLEGITKFKATVYYSRIKGDISIIGINYDFTNSEDEQITFKGIHKQKWKNGLIITEDFYTDDYLNLPEFEGIVYSVKLQ